MLGGEAIEHEISPVSLMISGCCTASASVWCGLWRTSADRRKSGCASPRTVYHKNIRVTDAKTLELVKQAREHCNWILLLACR